MVRLPLSIETGRRGIPRSGDDINRSRTAISRRPQYGRTDGSGCACVLHARLGDNGRRMRAVGLEPSVRVRHARNLFAGLGPTYDAVGAVLSFGQDPRWRRFMVSRVAVPAGGAVLPGASRAGPRARRGGGGTGRRPGGGLGASEPHGRPAGGGGGPAAAAGGGGGGRRAAGERVRGWGGGGVMGGRRGAGARGGIPGGWGRRRCSGGAPPSTPWLRGGGATTSPCCPRRTRRGTSPTWPWARPR